MNMMNLQEQEFDAGILARQVPISKSLDEFLTLDYGRAPYDVWIEASNSTYKRLLKVLVN